MALRRRTPLKDEMGAWVDRRLLRRANGRPPAPYGHEDLGQNFSIEVVFRERNKRYFEPYGEALGAALRRLGPHVMVRSGDEFASDADATILIGIHEFSVKAIDSLAQRRVVVGIQTEQLAAPEQGAERFGSVRISAVRDAVLNLDAVIDWSATNAALLARWHPVVDHVPYGFVEIDSFRLAEHPTPTFDLAFVGDVTALTGRRGRILHQLGSHFSVNPVHRGVWGAAKFALLQDCRIALNLHVEASGVYEAPRFYDILGAGIPLVSEPVNDPFPFESGRDFVEGHIVNLTAIIHELLQDRDRRELLAENGRTTARRFGIEASARQILRRVFIAHARGAAR